jgi:two-component system sensor histidine kinase YesM
MKTNLIRLGILKKVIIGYIFIVFVPICVFGTVVYHLFNNEILKDYVVGKQQLVQNAYTNLKVNMTQIEGLYNVIEYNQNIIQYLSGFYESDAEQIYNYVNYIHPLLNYIRTSNPSIENIKIYKSYTELISFKPDFVNINEMQENADILPKLDFSGMWVYDDRSNDDVPRLKYYQKIYDNEYVNVLGIIEISINNHMIKQFLDSVKTINLNYQFLLNSENKITYRSMDVKNNISQNDVSAILGEIGRNKTNYFYMFNKNLVINIVNIEELGLKAVVLSDANEEFKQVKKDMNLTFAILVFLLMVFSAIYYFTASAITKRILKLAKHMRKVDERNLSPYYGEQGNDEVGFLVSSYNSMINRIDELVNTVHRTEILRKEAAYTALQAQIKPHFLYNTLESLRMMAQLNNDIEVANMCFSFGRLIRYCLSNDNDKTLLQNELDNIENYLKISKIRMGERLTYTFDIQVDIHTFACPKFILQPLVENSIMHGLFNIRKESILKVNVFEDKDYLYIQISDNGKGIKAERLAQLQDVLNNAMDPQSLQTNNSGFGIYNVNERIKAFYGVDSRLVLESREGEGTLCTVKLRK